VAAEERMKPLREQTILVTGATDGLGKAVAIDLARRGAEVIVHGRDAARIARAVEEIGHVSPSPVRSCLADFASLEQVRAMAKQVVESERRLDVLVNNAGIGTRVPGDGRAVSRDGHELRFAVNYLAPFLLTHLLLPLLEASKPARIVNVSSAGQQAIEFDDVMLKHDYSGTRAYCQSKLAQILFTKTLADELAKEGVTVNALHPATYMPTKIVASPISTLEEGVDATVRLAIDPSLESTTGRYFNGKRESRAHEQAYDARARVRLDEISRELTGLAPRRS
jgi:NAD(P)-dependent dehydrogenase (short-subunit alcohol dehydrogenase family)